VEPFGAILPRFEFALQFACFGAEALLDFGFSMSLKQICLFPIGVALFELAQPLALGALELALQRQAGILETSRFIQKLAPQFHASIDLRSKVAQSSQRRINQEANLSRSAIDRDEAQARQRLDAEVTRIENNFQKAISKKDVDVL
jgi:hypothetical protein